MSLYMRVGNPDSLSGCHPYKLTNNMMQKKTDAFDGIAVMLITILTVCR